VVLHKLIDEMVVDDLFRLPLLLSVWDKYVEIILGDVFLCVLSTFSPFEFPCNNR
jgi:hypothetical protein